MALTISQTKFDDRHTNYYLHGLIKLLPSGLIRSEQTLMLLLANLADGQVECGFKPIPSYYVGGHWSRFGKEQRVFGCPTLNFAFNHTTYSYIMKRYRVAPDMHIFFPDATDESIEYITYVVNKFLALLQSDTKPSGVVSTGAGVAYVYSLANHYPDLLCLRSDLGKHSSTDKSIWERLAAERRSEIEREYSDLTQSDALVFLLMIPLLYHYYYTKDIASSYVKDPYLFFFFATIMRRITNGNPYYLKNFKVEKDGTSIYDLTSVSLTDVRIDDNSTLFNQIAPYCDARVRNYISSPFGRSSLSYCSQAVLIGNLLTHEYEALTRGAQVNEVLPYFPLSWARGVVGIQNSLKEKKFPVVAVSRPFRDNFFVN